MSVPFSEDLWQRLSALWRRDKKEEEEVIGYDDPQVKQMLDVMMVSRRSMKAAEKQKYDIDRAWRRVEKQTAGGWRVPGWCRYAAAVTVLFFSVWGWVTYNRESALPVTGELTDVILPGVSKAELILASGERIILGTQTEIRDIEELGVKITNDTSGGELKYETGSTEDSTIIAYNTLIVPKGGEYMVRLPDGSQVWLNSETTIRFPVRFAAGKREVQLCGEAFFKVCRDTTAPFQVSTENGEITVLGTSFNVSTYREDNYWQITLVEGSVRIAEQGRTVVLKPSEQYTVGRCSGQRKVVAVDAGLYTSWVDGKFYFKAYTFEEIVKKLERWYDFTMVYQDEEVKQMRFTGSINKHSPVTEVLRFLEMTTGIRFKVEGKQIIVSKI